MNSLFDSLCLIFYKQKEDGMATNCVYFKSLVITENNPISVGSC